MFVVLFGASIEPEYNARRARLWLQRYVSVVASSRFFMTPSRPLGLGIWFLNYALAVEATNREQLLEVLARVENQLSRVRGCDPNAPRSCDLDLIASIANNRIYLERDIADDIYRNPRDNLHILLPLADLAYKLDIHFESLHAPQMR